MNRKQLGNHGEKIAMWYLQKRGYIVLGRNIHSRWGEIDILLKKGDILHFVEVKTRASERFGNGVEAYTKEKKKRCEKAAISYLIQSKKQEAEWQMDLCVIRISREKIWIKYFENLE